MDHPQLLVYKASAGSGKTFTLAVEYMKLLIRNPKAYRNILAVTFTNKATTEMKERILGQLYGIYTADKDSEPYMNVLKEELDIPEEEIRQRAGNALTLMIHDYSRFRVETIDSFFQSVMRNLARELELGANLNIDLDNYNALSEAVDSMIEKLDRHSPVLYWLLDYIAIILGCVSRNNIHKKIDDNVALVSESLESLESVLEDKIEQETINRTTAVNKIEADYKEAENNVHALKGLAGNLGVNSVYNASCLMLKEIRTGDKNRAIELFDFVKEEFLQACEVIKTADS